jgi:hypothetical protein
MPVTAHTRKFDPATPRSAASAQPEGLAGILARVERTEVRRHASRTTSMVLGNLTGVFGPIASALTALPPATVSIQEGIERLHGAAQGLTDRIVEAIEAIDATDEAARARVMRFVAVPMVCEAWRERGAILGQGTSDTDGEAAVAQAVAALGHVAEALKTPLPTPAYAQGEAGLAASRTEALLPTVRALLRVRAPYRGRVRFTPIEDFARAELARLHQAADAAVARVGGSAVEPIDATRLYQSLLRVSGDLNGELLTRYGQETLETLRGIGDPAARRAFLKRHPLGLDHAALVEEFDSNFGAISGAVAALSPRPEPGGRTQAPGIGV